MHQHCFHRVLKLGREEGLCVSIAIHLDRIVLDRNGQDVGNRAKNWKSFFMEEEGGAASVVISLHVEIKNLS